MHLPFSNHRQRFRSMLRFRARSILCDFSSLFLREALAPWIRRLATSCGRMMNLRLAAMNSANQPMVSAAPDPSRKPPTSAMTFLFDQQSTG